MRRDDERLRDILEASERLAELVGRGRETFDADWLVRAGVERFLLTVGEAAGVISVETRIAHPGVDWSGAVGMRNRLVHGYHNLDGDVVWGVAEQSIPPFAEAVREVLRSMETGADSVSEAAAAWSPSSVMLSPAQVAERLAVSVRTVHAWIAEGRLAGVRTSERVTRVPAGAVEAFVAASTRPATQLLPVEAANRYRGGDST